MRRTSGPARAAAAITLLATLATARGDEPDPALVKRWAEQLRGSLGWYRLESGRARGTAMKPEIVHRWVNDIRQQKGETALVVWSDAGRPAALASVYPWQDRLQYELVSLARERGLVAEDEGRVAWAPRAPGVTFRRLDDAEPPARTATARLAQMKAIAERFRVAILNDVNGKENREALRLLPKPIHRDDPAATATAHPDLVDGAMFAFVVGTDPEAVLMVEAARRDGREGWQYAFGRATGWRVEAKLGAEVVWTAGDQPSWNDPGQPGIVLGRKLVD